MEPKKNALFVQGNHACFLGAVRAGCQFFAGYPITPSTEIAELCASEFPKMGGRFIQMEDEIAAMGAVIGASLTGLKSMTATSGPGFSLKQENIGFAIMAEVPCVIVDVQRGGPSTGLPTQSSQSDVLQARWGTHGDHEIIALAPSTIPEIYTATIRCFNLAERYRTPVILLLDEIVGHMREVLVEPPADSIEIWNRTRPTCSPAEYLPYRHTESGIPEMADFGSGYRYHVTGLCHDETGFPTNDPKKIDRHVRRLISKIGRHRDEIIEYSTRAIEDADVVLVSYGSSARSAKRALDDARAAGLKVGLFKPMTIWPFPEEALRLLANRVRNFIVCETNMGQMKLEVERIVGGKAAVHLVNTLNGEPITPQSIVDRIREVM